MEVNIRQATASDLNSLTVINSFGEIEGIPKYVNKSDVLIAETEGRSLGFLYWKRSFLGDDNWFLTQITIDRGWRRKGVGEKLWSYFLDYAKQNNIRKVFATIDDSNTASICLANKHGAIDAGYIDLENEIRKLYRFDL